MIGLTEQSFQAEVIDNSGLVLVDFWAPWCGPCRMVAPVLEDISQEYRGKIKIVKVNVDESPKLAEEYRIRSIPTLLLFKNGQTVDRIVGALPKTKLSDKLKKWVA
jgi:thioredoxin 1